MPKVRIDAWSHEEDLLVKKTVLKHIEKGSTQLNAFEEVADKINRTGPGVGFRWNSNLRHLFIGEIAEAKRKRRQNKKSQAKTIKTITIPIKKEVKPSPKPIAEIEQKEFKGERVVTFKDVDEVHGRVGGTAKRNFQNNKGRFIEGEDFYQITKDEIRTEFNFGSNAPSGVLLTESGYLMLVKSFTDDLSWEVQRQLVNSYFKIKQIKRSQTVHSYMIEDPIQRAEKWIVEQKEKLMLEQQVAEYQPKVTYYDKILQSTDCLTVTQIAKDYGMTARQLNKILHAEGIQYKLSGQWLLYKNHANNGYTKSETTHYERKDGSTGTSLLTKWTQKGRLFIHDILTDMGYDPDDLND